MCSLRPVCICLRERLRPVTELVPAVGYATELVPAVGYATELVPAVGFVTEMVAAVVQFYNC